MKTYLMNSAVGTLYSDTTEDNNISPWPKKPLEAKNHPVIKKMRENGAAVIASDNHEDHQLSGSDRFHITNGRMVMIAPPERGLPYRSFHPDDTSSLHCQHLCNQYADKVQKERLNRPCVYTPLTNAGFDSNQPRDEKGRWTKNVSVTGDNPEK